MRVGWLSAWVARVINSLAKELRQFLKAFIFPKAPKPPRKFLLRRALRSRNCAKRVPSPLLTMLRETEFFLEGADGRVRRAGSRLPSEDSRERYHREYASLELSVTSGDLGGAYLLLDESIG
jgi:hypothetical protein